MIDCHRTRGDSSVFVLDAVTSECLYYESVTGYPQTTVAHVPRDILASHPEIEIRNDLIDCCIDVCSVEVSTWSYSLQQTSSFSNSSLLRFLRCFKTISIIWTSEETSCMEF